MHMHAYAGWQAPVGRSSTASVRVRVCESVCVRACLRGVTRQHTTASKGEFSRVSPTWQITNPHFSVFVLLFLLPSFFSPPLFLQHGYSQLLRVGDQVQVHPDARRGKIVRFPKRQRPRSPSLQIVTFRFFSSCVCMFFSNQKSS